MPRSIAFLPTGTSALASFGRNDDAVDFLRDQRVDHRDLVFGGRLGRRRIDDLHAADLLRGFLGAVGASVEIAVAEIFYDHPHALACGKSRRLERDWECCADRPAGDKPQDSAAIRREVIPYHGALPNLWQLCL